MNEPAEYPSMDFVRAELNAEAAELERRSDSVTTRAGLILAAAGVLVPLALGMGSAWALPGVGLGVLSAVLAALAFRPGVFKGLDPVSFRLNYLHVPEAKAKRDALDRRVTDYAANAAVVKKQVKCLKWSVGFLVAAIVSVGGFVGVARLVAVFTS